MTQAQRKKLINICLLLLFLLFAQEVLLFKFYRPDSLIAKLQKKWMFSGVIEKGLKFYTPQKMEKLRGDEYFLLREINRRESRINIPAILGKYSEDPFKRFIDKNEYIANLKFYPKDFSQNNKLVINNSFYLMDWPYSDYLNDPYDDVLYKALYCDLSGYTDSDFSILKKLEKGDGGYQDTHFLLSLLLLKENKCYQEKLVDEQINNITEKIIKAEEEDRIFSDLYAERIVFLYWAGYGQSIKRSWIYNIENNLKNDPGWRDRKALHSDGHTTGLALLSLIYYREGEEKQSFYK